MAPSKRTKNWTKSLTKAEAERLAAEDQAASRLVKALEQARKECRAIVADAYATDAAKARARETGATVGRAIKALRETGGNLLQAEIAAMGRSGLSAVTKQVNAFDPKLAGQIEGFNLLPLQAMAKFDQVVLPKWVNLIDDAANAVAFAIETGMARGEGYAKLVKRVLGEHGTGSLYTTQYGAANRLVRQAVNEAYALSAQDTIAYAASLNPGIKQMWISRLVRSTPICAGLHGQVVDVGAPFKWNQWEGVAPPAIGVGAEPKYHICHSTVVAWHPDWDIDVKPLTPQQLAQATDKKGPGLNAPEGAGPARLPLQQSTQQGGGMGGGPTVPVRGSGGGGNEPVDRLLVRIGSGEHKVTFADKEQIVRHISRAEFFSRQSLGDHAAKHVRLGHFPEGLTADSYMAVLVDATTVPGAKLGVSARGTAYVVADTAELASEYAPKDYQNMLVIYVPGPGKIVSGYPFDADGEIEWERGMQWLL